MILNIVNATQFYAKNYRFYQIDDDDDDENYGDGDIDRQMIDRQIDSTINKQQNWKVGRKMFMEDHCCFQDIRSLQKALKSAFDDTGTCSTDLGDTSKKSCNLM